MDQGRMLDSPHPASEVARKAGAGNEVEKPTAVCPCLQIWRPRIVVMITFSFYISPPPRMAIVLLLHNDAGRQAEDQLVCYY